MPVMTRRARRQEEVRILAGLSPQVHEQLGFRGDHVTWTAARDADHDGVRQVLTRGAAD